MRMKIGKASIWMIGFLLSVLCLAGCKKTQEDGPLTVYFFHNNPCASCHEEETFRQMVADEIVGDKSVLPYQIEAYYVYGTEAAACLEKVIKQCGAEDEAITYPFAAVNGRIFFGYEEIKKELYDCLKDGENAGQ